MIQAADVGRLIVQLHVGEVTCEWPERSDQKD